MGVEFQERPYHPPLTLVHHSYGWSGSHGSALPSCLSFPCLRSQVFLHSLCSFSNPWWTEWKERTLERSERRSQGSGTNGNSLPLLSFTPLTFVHSSTINKESEPARAVERNNKVNTTHSLGPWWWEQQHEPMDDRTLLTPGLDNTRLFMSLTAGAGTRCMSLLSSSPSLSTSHSPAFTSVHLVTFELGYVRCVRSPILLTPLLTYVHAVVIFRKWAKGWANGRKKNNREWTGKGGQAVGEGEVAGNEPNEQGRPMDRRLGTFISFH